MFNRQIHFNEGETSGTFKRNNAENRKPRT